MLFLTSLNVPDVVSSLQMATTGIHRMEERATHQPMKLAHQGLCVRILFLIVSYVFRIHMAMKV